MDKMKKVLLRIPVLSSVLVYGINVLRSRNVFVSLLPQDEKIKVFLDYAKNTGCTVFVETGTHVGYTIDKCKEFFDELYSIELSHEYFTRAQKRFSGCENIHLFEGDSATVLPEIVKLISAPTLFWLDAHHSGGDTARGSLDTPVIAEVKFILANVSNFCILIDDARCFNNKNGYPTINFLRKLVKNYNKENKNKLLELSVTHDIIRIVPVSK